MIERWCDLNGPRMIFRAEDADLLAPLERTWLRMACEPAAEADFVLTISRGEVSPAPADATLLFDGLLPDRHPCVVTRIGEDEHYRIDNRVSLLLSERAGRLVVAPGSEAMVRLTLTTLAVSTALVTGGQHILHAAALVMPDSDAAIMIFGPSGYGKTTTALSLLPAGFKLLTDDSSVVMRAAGGHHVWALARPLKVHERTAALLPWIAPALGGTWDKEGEQAVGPEALAELGSIAPPRPHPIAAIVALGERMTGEDHAFRPMAKADALARLAGDNIGRSLTGVSPAGSARLARMAELVAALPTFELRAGADLRSLPATIMTGLRSPTAVPA